MGVEGVGWPWRGGDLVDEVLNEPAHDREAVLLGDLRFSREPVSQRRCAQKQEARIAGAW